MNSLAKEFAGKGLIVVGVTSDMDTEKTDAWCRETGTKYPYGYDEGGVLQRQLGVRTIPHAVLVAPGGKILYSGNPAGLDHALVEKAVENALKTPLWKNEAANDVLTAIRADKYGDAWRAAAALGSQHEGEKILGYVKRHVESVVYAILQAHKAGDFLGAQERAEKAADSLSGTPDVEVVHMMLEDLAQDTLAQNVIEGQRALREVMERYGKLRSKKDAQAILTELDALIAKYPDSIVARQGEETAKALAKRLKIDR